METCNDVPRTRKFQDDGVYRLGGGYDNDAYLLAGILINAAVNLKYRTGECRGHQANLPSFRLPDVGNEKRYGHGIYDF